LRGVAALAVVLHHLGSFKLAGNIAPHAELAVDFFFVLSGFVVAHAYGQALLGRMSWADFALRRGIRLLPLAVVGALFGLMVLILKWKLFPGREEPLSGILISGLFNLFMLPSFFTGAHYDHAIFPGDGPLWSLFFELAVNLIWAWLGVRWTTRQLAAFVIASAAVVVTLSVLHGSTRMGVGSETFWGGAARASFGFSLGVLIYRLRDHITPRSMPLVTPLLALALCIAVAAPGGFVQTRALNLVWDLVWILFALPLIVLIGAGQGSAGRLGKVLGELSYPVYVLHWPILAVIGGLHQRFFPHGNIALFVPGELVLIVVASWLTLKVYDEPARRHLSRRLPASARDSDPQGRAAAFSPLDKAATPPA
jgi:peptidoglycan/LPS O-acetylase OafA/YrhL